MIFFSSSEPSGGWGVVPIYEPLSLAYGQIGRFREHRAFFLAGPDRIQRLELEVVLVDQPADAGVGKACQLLDCLGIQPARPIEGTYLDPLRARRAWDRVMLVPR